MIFAEYIQGYDWMLSADIPEENLSNALGYFTGNCYILEEGEALTATPSDTQSIVYEYEVTDAGTKADDYSDVPCDDDDFETLTDAQKIQRRRKILREKYTLDDLIARAGKVTRTAKIVTDTEKVDAKIAEIKAQLAETDVDVTRCYEASLLGETYDVDIQALATERKALRAQIKELEALKTSQVDDSTSDVKESI